MRTHLPTAMTATRRLSRHATRGSSWLEFSALVLVTVALVDCLNRPFNQPPMLAPLLAVPPALAGIGAATVRRPLGYGGGRLLAAIALAAEPPPLRGRRPGGAIFHVV